MVCVGAALLVFGQSFGLSEFTPLLLVCFVVAGGVANLALIRLLHVRWYRPWLTYVYCLIDVSLVALAVVYLGPGGTIAGFFLVVLPCAFRPNRALGIFAVSTASAAYLVASFLHGLLSGETTAGMFGLPPKTLLDMFLFIAVALTLMAAHTDLFRRLTGVHTLVTNVIQGFLEPPTPSTRKDLLGQLEHSLNIMLEQVAAAVDAVELESEEISVLARRFAQSADDAGESSRHVTMQVARLAQELGDLQVAAETGESESANAA